MINSIKDLTLLNHKKILGEGAFSEVVQVRSKKDQKTYALKKINTRFLNIDDRNNLKVEVQLHKTLDHPNIIKFYQ